MYTQAHSLGMYTQAHSLGMYTHGVQKTHLVLRSAYSVKCYAINMILCPDANANLSYNTAICEFKYHKSLSRER